jgi:P pilus assembly chaperone PapD
MQLDKPRILLLTITNPTGYNINLTTGNVGQGLNTQPIGNNISNIKYV